MLQNMFDIGYFSGPVGTFPTGWSELEDDKNYPNIRSRLPRSQQEEEAESVEEFEKSSVKSESESSNEDDDSTAQNMTRMTEESSDEDAAPPHRRVSGRTLPAHVFESHLSTLQHPNRVEFF